MSDSGGFGGSPALSDMLVPIPPQVVDAGATSARQSSDAALSPNELHVLEMLGTQHRLTFTQLACRCRLDAEEVHIALAELRARGLVVRLQTVIESFSLQLAHSAISDPADVAIGSGFGVEIRAMEGQS